MYDKSDPRAGLSMTTTTAPVWSDLFAGRLRALLRTPPQESGDWGRTWYDPRPERHRRLFGS